MDHKLRHQGTNILKQLLKDLQAARGARMLWSMDIVKLNERIADIISQDRLLAQLKQQGLVDPDLFISRRDRLAEQLRSAKLEKERLAMLNRAKQIVYHGIVSDISCITAV